MSSLTETESLPAAVTDVRDVAHELRMCASIGDVLYWDDRAARPMQAEAWRAEQRAWLAQRLHELRTSDKVERAISAAEDALADTRNSSTDTAAALADEVRLMRRDFTRAKALPADFAARFEATAARARAAWDQARLHNDFARFAPLLERSCELAREHAEAVGFGNEPYDAALAEWEPGVDTAFLDRCFAQVQRALTPLLDKRPDTPKQLTLRPLSETARRALERDVLDAVGFDQSAGALVQSSRAFCHALGPHDVRMTSRFHETPFFKGIHSTLHEAGHAIYAQSFGRLGVIDSLAVAPGLGLDESQSRMVENLWGRSKAFSQFMWERLQLHAPDVYPDAGEFDRFYAEVNSAEHPARRLGSDELSYNLHILIRYNLERELVNGTLAVRDLPDAWAAAAKETLGVDPIYTASGDLDHANGCLQDVHWSLGQWGYFPTYMLGNLYGTQLLATAAEQLDVDLDTQLAQGDTTAIRGWLDENVYRHGRRFTGRDLVQRVTGEPASTRSMIEYLQRKFG